MQSEYPILSCHGIALDSYFFVPSNINIVFLCYLGENLYLDYLPKYVLELLISREGRKQLIDNNDENILIYKPGTIINDHLFNWDLISNKIIGYSGIYYKDIDINWHYYNNYENDIPEYSEYYYYTNLTDIQKNKYLSLYDLVKKFHKYDIEMYLFVACCRICEFKPIWTDFDLINFNMYNHIEMLLKDLNPKKFKLQINKGGKKKIVKKCFNIIKIYPELYLSSYHMNRLYLFVINKTISVDFINMISNEL